MYGKHISRLKTRKYKNEQGVLEIQVMKSVSLFALLSDNSMYCHMSGFSVYFTASCCDSF